MLGLEGVLRFDFPVNREGSDEWFDQAVRYHSRDIVLLFGVA